MVGAVLDGIQAEMAASGADIGASEEVAEVIEPEPEPEPEPETEEASVAEEPAAETPEEEPSAPEEPQASETAD